MVRLLLVAGIGIPELLRGEVGALVSRRAEIYVVASAPLLQPAVGFGGRFLAGPVRADGPPRHAFTAGLDLLVNPKDPRLMSHGETLTSSAVPAVGYQLLSDGGFVARAELGFLVEYEDIGVGGGPDLRLAVGYVFP